MTVLTYFDRAYINICDSNNETNTFCSEKNFMNLIHAVAMANPFGDGNELLYNSTTYEVYERRTKSYIVKKTNSFIAGISQYFSIDENMATFVSLRQLKKLIKSFSQERKRISCYGLIYVYIIYTLIKDKSTLADECLKFIHQLYDYVQNYLWHNRDDQLATFFYECYDPIINAIKNDVELSTDQLPSAPRYDPEKNTD